MNKYDMLFKFGKRALPQRLKDANVTELKHQQYHSKFGNSNAGATLCGALLSAVDTYHQEFDGNSSNSAAGIYMSETAIIIEKRFRSESNQAELVKYQSENGQVSAALLDTVTQEKKPYLLKDHTLALWLCLIAVLLDEMEFQAAYQKYTSTTDPAELLESAAILSDNAYRRIHQSGSSSFSIPLDIPDSGNIPLWDFQNDADLPVNSALMSGSFKVLPVKTVPSVQVDTVEARDFVGQFSLSNREWTNAERTLIPSLPDWYIIPNYARTICKHLQMTTGKAQPIRNVMLRGPAGTGKSMAAKAIAAGLSAPFVFYTCSAGTEEADLLGYVQPNVSGVSSKLHDPELEEDMIFDPANAYLRITGRQKLDATTEDCQAALQQMSSDSSERDFAYLETDLVKAIRYGWVVELQEPSCILQSGVLTRLNALLEGDSIMLPTGETLQRHPDCVIIVTTNVNYAGCRNMNESFIDRMRLIFDVALPDAATMRKRAMAITGFTDEETAGKMTEVVMDIDRVIQETGTSNGLCGMRGLISWMESTLITNDPYSSALFTVISRASSNAEDQKMLVDTVLETRFMKM